MEEMEVIFGEVMEIGRGVREEGEVEGEREERKGEGSGDFCLSEVVC